MQWKIRVIETIRTTSEITSFFEISFIRRASSLRHPAALLRFPFPLCFPIFSSIYLQRLRLFQCSDIEDKKERCSRRHYVGPQDRSLLPVTPRLCSLIPTDSRESYEVPFGRSRGDSRISSSPTNSVSIFAFHLEVNAPETHVKLLRGVMLIIRAWKTYPRDFVSNSLYWREFDKST